MTDLVANSLPTQVVTHQLQVERRTEKVHHSQTDTLLLCHATDRGRQLIPVRGTLSQRGLLNIIMIQLLLKLHHHTADKPLHVVSLHFNLTFYFQLLKSVQCSPIMIDRVSREYKPTGNVCPFVRLFPLYLLNQMTTELQFFCVYGSWPQLALGLKVNVKC